GRFWWRWNRDECLRQMEANFTAMQQEAAKPANQRRPIPTPTNPVAQIFAPVFSQAFDRFDHIDARNRLILCALAIRAYRLKHSRLPISLNDLGLDPSLIVDPYTGRPLIYRMQGSDYLLYSVGPDLKDDGGVPMDEKQWPGGAGDLG